MKKLKVFLTVALTLMVSVSATLALTMSVDEFKQLVENPMETFGANPGPDKYQTQVFHEGFKYGGDVFATTTTGTAQTLAKSAITEKTRLMVIIPNKPTLALTTMASSSMPWLGYSAGMTKTVRMENATSSTAAITITAGTGVELQEDQGGVVIIDQGEYADLTFMREYDGGVARGSQNVLLTVVVYQISD